MTHYVKTNWISQCKKGDNHSVFPKLPSESLLDYPPDATRLTRLRLLVWIVGNI